MDRTSMFTAASITWKERLGNANTIMLVTHVNPDGDAIGSLIGLMMALPQLTEARIIPVLQQPIPAYLNWVSGTEQSIALTADMHWPDPDLIIAVDCASADRIGGIAKPHLDRLEHATIIQIDHHATNTLFGVNNLIVPDSCATCEIITEFLPYLGLTLTAGIATPLLLGIMTDTQSFQIYDAGANVVTGGESLQCRCRPCADRRQGVPFDASRSVDAGLTRHQQHAHPRRRGLVRGTARLGQRGQRV